MGWHSRVHCRAKCPGAGHVGSILQGEDPRGQPCQDCPAGRSVLGPAASGMFCRVKCLGAGRVRNILQGKDPQGWPCWEHPTGGGVASWGKPCWEYPAKGRTPRSCSLGLFCAEEESMGACAKSEDNGRRGPSSEQQSVHLLPKDSSGKPAPASD